MNIYDGFVIPPHTHVVASGDTASTGPTQVLLYKGDPNGSPAGSLVATITVTYSGNNNILTKSIEYAYE